MEIDYSRVKEFLQSESNPFLKLHTDDILNIAKWPDIEEMQQAYVHWLKQQQKPAHLDFEVK